MKRYNFIYWIVCAVLLLFSACTDEFEKRANEVKEGVPVVVKLGFTPDEPVKIETRAGETTTNVQNLYVLIFDSKGVRLPEEYGGGLFSVEQGSTIVNLSTTSGKRYIYGVANLTTSTLAVDKAALDAIDNVEELKTLPLTLKEKGINESTGQFLMSGFCTEKNDTGLKEAPLCYLSPDGTITTETMEIPVLKLKRLQSRIKFEVTTGGRAKSFVLTSYSVVNIPTQSPMYEDGMQGTVTASREWFDVRDNKTLDGGSKSFSFYMLENKQQKRGEPFPSGIADNEANKYRSDTLKYAPENGTYIILKGAYEGTEDKYEKGEIIASNQPVQASVVYYIYLGYVNKVLEDYNSLRNKDYTYHIQVNGVNSIIVEAELKQDNAGVGGDVFYESGGAIINVDAHYASKVLKFKKSELAKDNAAKNIMIKVSSHNTLGFESKDTEWLTFYEGGEIKSGVEKPIRYPGESKVLSADKFVKRLQAIATSNDADDKEYYFTCFINENYPIAGVDKDENSWTNFVNTPDRMAQIICRAKSHNDSQTIDAAYLIRQKPIYTFFKSGNQPWGLESVNETTEYKNNIEIGLTYGDPMLGQYGQDSYNGRANMITELSDHTELRRWYKDYFFPQQDPKYSDYSDYLNTAYAACMQRNRDENGDGQISDDEIKWYLPAIFQYTDMSIGANALPKTVQLYSDDDYNASGYVGTKNSWRFKHYVSNTSTMIYWGEEGGPYSGNGGDSGWDAAWQQSWKRQIRCVRNLGPNSLKKDVAPSPVAVKNSNNVMDLSQMSPDALRPNKVSNAELGTHTERDISSLPYQGSFLVAKDFCSQPNSFTYKGGNRGSYALSDRNGYYYIMAQNDGVTYNYSRSFDSPSNVDRGPYRRENSSMTWVGDNKGNAMYSDSRGYYWGSNSNPKGTWKQTTPDTYVYVGSGKGIYEPNSSTTDFGWSAVNIAIDKGGKSPCSTYSEGDNDLGSWRLPNMRELLIMVSHGGYTGSLLMSRTYYSFYIDDIEKHGKVQQSDGQLSGYTIYSPMDDYSREGFAYNTSVVYLINPGNTAFKIRCVKDQ